MSDNFNFKQYLFENKLGAYSKAKENLEEAPIQWKEFGGMPQTGGESPITLRVDADTSGEYVAIEYKKEGGDWVDMGGRRSEIINKIKSNTRDANDNPIYSITLPTGNYFIPGEAVKQIKGQSSTSTDKPTHID